MILLEFQKNDSQCCFENTVEKREVKQLEGSSSTNCRWVRVKRVGMLRSDL